MYKFYQEISKNRYALLTLTAVNIKTTVATTRLGWLWWFIDPLVMMAIYYFIIRVVFDRGGENYHLFVLTGIVLWQFFSRALNVATSSLTKNSMLIKQTGVSLSTIIAIPPLVQMFFGFIGVLIILIWNFQVIGSHSVAILLILALTGTLAFGFGLLLAILVVFFKDTGKLVGYTLRAGFFLSPVLYPISRIIDSDSVPEFIKSIYHLNPMAWIINASRTILLDGEMFNWQSFFIVFAFALFLVEIGLLLMRRYSNRIVKML